MPGSFDSRNIGIRLRFVQSNPVSICQWFVIRLVALISKVVKFAPIPLKVGKIKSWLGGTRRSKIVNGLSSGVPRHRQDRSPTPRLERNCLEAGPGCIVRTDPSRIYG